MTRIVSARVIGWVPITSFLTNKNNMRTFKIEFYQDKSKEYRWRLIASNGRTVADCGEGYARLSMCKRAWKAIASKASSGLIKEVGL